VSAGREDHSSHTLVRDVAADPDFEGRQPTEADHSQQPLVRQRRLSCPLHLQRGDSRKAAHQRPHGLVGGIRVTLCELLLRTPGKTSSSDNKSKRITLDAAPEDLGDLGNLGDVVCATEQPLYTVRGHIMNNLHISSNGMRLLGPVHTRLHNRCLMCMRRGNVHGHHPPRLGHEANETPRPRFFVFSEGPESLLTHLYRGVYKTGPTTYPRFAPVGLVTTQINLLGFASNDCPRAQYHHRWHA
jgi:hypothetical protein